MTNVADLFRMFGTLRRALGRKTLDMQTKDSIGALIARLAQTHGPRPALICEGETLTWHELNARANRVAHFLSARGIERGDCVAMMLENRTEFLITLLGIVKLGAVAGLLNTNQRNDVLAHSVSIINAKLVVFGEECCPAIADVHQQLDTLLKLNGRGFCFVPDQGDVSAPTWAGTLTSRDASLSEHNPAATDAIQLGDAAFFIYTSGTTGMPKAAIFGHHRFMNGKYGFGRICMKVTENERVYLCLPLYHATALTAGLGVVTEGGGCLVLRRKFSASQFFADIHVHQCTAFVYIGELCRYLLNQAERADDNIQPAKRCVGNGLRPDIWHAFKSRFAIEEIYEFYGASEGNNLFINAFNKNETIGFGALPHTLVRYDVDADVIVRDASGLCVPATKGEPGLMLSEIRKDARFDGYTNKAANEAKLVRNVRKQGDVYFNSGDLLRTVDVGFALWQRHYQFVDRIGDTFRWKGENCSTNEVAEVMQRFPGVSQANVYGVLVPGADGRAGMAAITLSPDVPSLDWRAFHQHLSASLPAYARPVFIRTTPALETTTTFKLLKSELRTQGFDPAKVNGDPIYVLQPGADGYVALDAALYAGIHGGSVRL